jgi:hypothetical protein
MSWRTIESAPKDGTEIILGAVGETWGAGYWEKEPNYWGETGWHFEADRGDTYAQHPCHPTHWHPLPEPLTACTKA